MSLIRSLCVYCGSSSRGIPEHHRAARQLGRGLAERGIELVYGGGHVGLMGLLADAVLTAGGKVTGIIPGHLHGLEVAHEGVTELLLVDSMHARKNLMFERSDGFVVLPGGLGTLDETFEIITWRQLRLHDKPIVIVDLGGYWAPFRALIDAVIDGGYAHRSIRRLFTVVDTVDAVFPALAAAPEPTVEPKERWL
jgi:uncharacterized protein (TIGR00730 family)